MSLSIELGRASEHRCGCCGKLSHTLRGFVSNEEGAYAVYMAGYTEQHQPQEGTVLVSIGDWTEGSQPADRAAVVMKVRKIEGKLEVMVVGPEGVPWNDTQVMGQVLSRQAALANPGPPLIDELDGPDDPDRARRLDWARLLKRTLAVDVLRCPTCSGPMRLIALIEDEQTARRILDHLGLPSRAPPRRPPWRPGQRVFELADRPTDLDGIHPPFSAD